MSGAKRKTLTSSHDEDYSPVVQAHTDDDDDDEDDKKGLRLRQWFLAHFGEFSKSIAWFLQIHTLFNILLICPSLILLTTWDVCPLIVTVSTLSLTVKNLSNI